MSLHVLADTPYAYNLQIIKEVGKQSNALDKSILIQPTNSPLSRAFLKHCIIFNRLDWQLYFCRNAESNVEKIFINYDESCLAMTLP